MGSLLDAIEAEVPTRRACQLADLQQRMIDDGHPDLADDVDKALALHKPDTAIARGLAKHGYVIKTGRISWHRRGECKCLTS